MEVPTELNGMLRGVKSNTNLNNKTIIPKGESKFNVDEEYRFLRKPKSSTTLKIQKSNQIKSIEIKPQSPSLNKRILRQEFFNNPKTDKYSTRKYEFHKQESALDENLCSQDSDEMESEVLDSNYNKKESLEQPQNLNNIKLLANLSLNYNEYHLANILHTKVMAHKNGFFANNIPDWYKCTFDKILPINWLEILEKSKKFNLENINHKIVLYALDEGSKPKIDSSENIFIETTQNEQVKELQNTRNITDSPENPIGFVRYKHLENSMKQYKHSAGRDVSYTSSEKPIKIPNSSKSNVRYKHLQGPWSK